MTNDDVELQRDLKSVFNERRDRCEKRRRAFFHVDERLPVVGVTGVVLSSPFLALTNLNAAFSALAPLSPTRQPQQSNLSFINKQQQKPDVDEKPRISAKSRSIISKSLFDYFRNRRRQTDYSHAPSMFFRNV